MKDGWYGKKTYSHLDDLELLIIQYYSYATCKYHLQEWRIVNVNKCTVTAASQATFLRKCCGKSSRPGLHHVSIHCIGLKFAWESYQILQSCLVNFGDPFLAMPSESLSWQQQRTGKGCGLKAGIPLQEQGTWIDLNGFDLLPLRDP